MPSKPTLRVDLGELDPYFEQRATEGGQPVNSVLRKALAQLLSGQEPRMRATGKRVLRSVTFASLEEQSQARARAQALAQPLGAALRAVAIDQLLGPSSNVVEDETQMHEAASGGMVTNVGLGESPTVRLELRLNPSELVALEDKAQAGRYRSTQALVISIARAFLLNAPVLDPAVVVTLGQRNLELVHISNALRELVQALESRKRLALLETFDVLEMLQRLDAHIELVGSALTLAQGRWVMQAQEA